MMNVTCEMIWVRDLLTEFGLTPECPIRLYCDNSCCYSYSWKFSISRTHKTH